MTRVRHFQAGQTGTVGGVEYRIVTGRKQAREEGQSDLRVDLRARDWVPVGMPLLFLLADFLCDNEDVLFPPEMGFAGGQKLVNYLDAARLLGWEAVGEQLRQERERAAERRAVA